MKTSLKKHFRYAFIYLFLALFVLNWYGDGQVIYGGDGTWPLDLKAYYEETRYVWLDAISPGFSKVRNLANFYPLGVYGNIAHEIGMDAFSFQRLVYFVSFFFSGFGFYLLVHILGAKRLGAFIAGLFYMYSPYALLVAWNPSYGRSFPFYCYLPVAVYFFLKYLDSKKGLINTSLSVGILGTALSLLGMSFNNPTFFLVFIGVLVFFSIYKLLGKVDRATIIKRTGIYLVITILLNSFWLLPFISGFQTAYDNADNEVGGLIDDSGTQLLNSVELSDGLRMSGLWTMHSGHKNEPYYTFHTYWFSSTYIFTSFIVLGVAIYGLISNKDKKMSFLLLLFAGALLANSGLRWESFSILPEKLYSLPYFGRAFRSVYLKLGFLLVVPIGILLGFSISSLRKRAQVVVIGAVIGAILLNAIPFFSGEIIKPQGKSLPGYSVTIHEEYEDLRDLLNDSGEFSRTLALPIPPTYNYLLWWGSDGFNGVYLLRNLTDSAMVFMGTRPLMKDFAASLDPTYLDQLGITNIILHKDVPLEDVPFYQTKDPNEIISFLQNLPLTVVKNTDFYTYFEINSENITPLFSSGSVEVAFEKISPVEYEVRISGIESSYSLLFNDTFDNGWVVSSIDDPTFALISHDEGNEFANEWEISSENTTHTLKVYFEPQNLADVGGKFSLGVAIALLGAGMGSYFREKKK